MHEYLEAIGFSGLKFRKHLKMLLSDVEESYDHEEIVPFALDMDWCERRKEYGETIGISIFGELDENSKFEKNFYVPYLRGTGITSYADVTVEKRMENELYGGIC